MEQLAKVLIYIHAFFGGLGLLTGITSIIVKKGGKIHRKCGIIFSYSMGISALLSLIIARIPNHENLFLFLIGVFTIYLVLAGNRALTLNHKTKMSANWIDKGISGAMLFTSIVMLIIGGNLMIKHANNSILFLFFGAFGLFMAQRDFHTFKVFRKEKNAWLVSHLGRMIAALIASVTAFIVAGLHIGTLWAWISPTILGTAYIIYWSRKIKTPTVKTEL